MADLVDQAHVDAAMSLLRADASLTVYPSAEGFTPVNPAPPYVRVYSSIGQNVDLPGNSADGLAKSYRVRFYCHCVGRSEYAATAVGMRVRAALLNVRPVISGRNAGFFRDEGDPPAPQRDDSTGTVVFDAIRTFTLLTTA